MPLIINMKKEVMDLLFKLGHNFASWQSSDTGCQEETAKAHWFVKRDLVVFNAKSCLYRYKLNIIWFIGWFVGF